MHDSHVVRQEKCTNCKLDWDSNNLAIYNDGHTHCFACSAHTNADGDAVETLERQVGNMVETGVFAALTDRHISKEICEAFNYQVGTYSGKLGGEYVTNEKVHIANYSNQFGDIVSQKIRAAGKRFTIKGDGGKAMPLFGAHRYQPTEKLFITVTEGELDALSIAQAQGKQFPVVSVPKGSKDAKNAIANNLEYLQGFKYVILAFDNDGPGREAAKECVELFEPGKVRVATWPMKDANELLVEGKLQEIKDGLWQAKEIRPDKLCTTSDLLQRILDRPTVGMEWPWKDLTNCTYGMRPEQLIVVGAAPSIGKTELAKDIILHMVAQGVKVGVFSFEQDPADTMRRIIGGVLNKRLHIPGEWWNEEMITKTAADLEGQIYLYDNFGGTKAEDIAPKIRYLAKAHGTKLFIIDHLTALANKIDGDERRGIEKIMHLLQGLTRELKCTILLVSHLSRDKQNGPMSVAWAEGRRPVLENLKGSGCIEGLADVVLGLRRNTVSQETTEQRTLTIECLKARLDGTKNGYTFQLMYNPATGKLEDISI